MSPSIAVRVSVSFLYSIIFVLSLAGNTLFLYIIWSKPRTRTNISFLFINMAVADLLMTIFVVPNSVAFYFRDGKWIEGVGGELICRLQNFFFTVSIAASIFTLTVMALDRFMAVMYPMRNKSCCGRKVCTLLIWLSSAVLMLPMVLTQSAKSGDCQSDWSLLGGDPVLGGKYLLTILLVVLYLFPLALMGCLYSFICHKLWRHERPGVVTEESTQRARAQGRKVVKTLVTILLVFAICWFPVHAYHMIVWAFPAKDLSHPPQYVMFLCFWAGHAHSAINPWMYINLNTKFRSAFFSIVLRRREPNTYTDSTRCTMKTRASQVKHNAVKESRET